MSSAGMVVQRGKGVNAGVEVGEGILFAVVDAELSKDRLRSWSSSLEAGTAMYKSTSANHYIPYYLVEYRCCPLPFGQAFAL